MIGIVRERLARPDAAAGSCSTGSRARWRRPRRSTRCSTIGAPLVVVDIEVPEDDAGRPADARGGSAASCGWNAAPGADGVRQVRRRAGAAARRRRRRSCASGCSVYARDTQPIVEFYQAAADVPVGRRRPDARRGGGGYRGGGGVGGGRARVIVLPVGRRDRADARGQPARGRGAGASSRRRWRRA